MSRATLARRYGPLLAVAAVQLLIIAVVPSRAPSATDNLSTQGLPGDTETGVVGDEGVPVYTDPVTGQTILGGPGGTTTSGGGSRTSGGGGGGGTDTGTGGGEGGGTGTPTAGDTKHCVKGRQYDPAVYEWAPPCVPKFTGNNGGSTYNRGVTKDSIKVMVMRGNYGTAVNTILENQGSPKPAEFAAFTEAAEKFVNSKYELYGRKIDFEYYQIKAVTGGETAPQDDQLREEMRQLVRDKNPFGVIWANSVSSATYEELSKLKVVNIGGYGFTDDFNVRWRPYHWDVQMGGYQLAENVANWYCNRLHGDGTAKAVYAGDSPEARYANLKNSPRKLGIISTNDPQNQATAERVISLVKSKCQAEVGKRTYYYEQNIQTLQTQRTDAYIRMTATDGIATTVMCFCDQVAPAFLYYTCRDEDYFPEHVIVATGIMDLDRVAQEYDHGAEEKATKGAKDDDGIYPAFENAFGLAQFPKQVSAATSPGAKIWNAAGTAGNPPHAAVDEDWNYIALMANLIQMAGAKLTPFTVETGAQQLGSLGNLTSEFSGQRSFAAGDYTWNDSLREVYWAPKTKSLFNGIPGSYTSLNNGRWFLNSQFPSGLLSLPPKPRP